MNPQVNDKPIFALYAHRYAQAGFAVFPLACGSKKPPHGSRGLLEATTDLRLIAEWSRINPCFNIGIRTGAESNTSVIDLDPNHGGFDSERVFRAQGKLWGDAGVSRTRSGGRHIWYAYHPAPFTGQNRLNQGIDIRNDGGYVVGAGSVVGLPLFLSGCWPTWKRKKPFARLRLPRRRRILFAWIRQRSPRSLVSATPDLLKVRSPAL